jgi:hypothetical protein
MEPGAGWWRYPRAKSFIGATVYNSRTFEEFSNFEKNVSIIYQAFAFGSILFVYFQKHVNLSV